MSSDDAQTIITIIILLIIVAAFLFPLGLFFIYVFFQTTKRKRISKRVLATQQQLIGNRQWLPVRYASESRFKSWFKIFPWEGAGILVFAPGSVLFMGETNAGVPVNVQFAPSNSNVNWIGKSPFPNGAVSWLNFTTQHETHYFSSETGAFVFGSNKSTRQIFDEASKSFGSPSA